MLSSNKYFRLNPECFLITGEKGSVVHNLYTGEAIWCDQADTAALVQSETNHPVNETVSVFRELKQKHWGFFSDKPPFVDKLRTFNIFRESRLWKETPYISMAVLQVSNVCNLNCPSCETSFCPICKVFPSTVEDGEPLSTGDWLDLITELKRFGTQWIVFTGGEALVFTDLETLVRHASSLGIVVQVHTNGLLPLPPDFPDVAFSILLSDVTALPVIVENFGARHNVTLFNSGVDPQIIAETVRSSWRVQVVSPEPPTIEKKNLMEIGFERFFTRKLNDSCLNGKIYVTHNGAVLPCFGHKDSPVANIKRNGLAASVKVLVENYWNVAIDKIDSDRKCNQCEYRYCCNSCRYLDVEQKCKYDIKEGTWQ